MARQSWTQPHQLPLSLLLLLVAFFHASYSSDADVLLEFKAAISDPTGVLQNWIPGSAPCNNNHPRWSGIICQSGTVLGLQLENMSLAGHLNLDALAVLSSVRTLSFKNNSFEGPIPNVGKLGALRSIYLSGNKFSGTIRDDEFRGMGSLRRVHLSHNKFNGTIPSSLTSVPKLVEVRLDDNDFTGQIPDFRQQGLTLVNFSYNNLAGSIPDSLSKMDASLFAGNKDLCGPPLGVACKSSKKKLSTELLVVIILIALAVIASVVSAILRRRGREEAHRDDPSSSKKFEEEETNRGDPSSSKKFEEEEETHRGDLSSSKKFEEEDRYYDSEELEQGLHKQQGRKKGATAKEREQGQLVFVKEDREKFELHDLLRASAHALARGHLGSSYKAILMNGPTMVVRKFKDMNGVGRVDFQQHMKRLGRLSHPNLLPLVAYFYIEGEKLLVTDYIPNGSLADLLHGNRDPSKPGLDWPTRLKVVKGVARGLAYLHHELPMLSLPHGHLKSSNVLLGNSFVPLLMDYALMPVMSQPHAAHNMVAYKAPECIQYGRTSKKSDVWSLGILILEVLTGKSPANYLQHSPGGTDLARWVNSVVMEEWIGEVFDTQMNGTRNGEGEMLKLLQIGLGCSETDVEQRWDIQETLEKIEELRERDNDEENSPYISEGEMYSSSAMTADDFSFTTTN